MTFPPCFAPTSPRRTRVNIGYNGGSGSFLQQQGQKQQQQQQQSLWIPYSSPMMPVHSGTSFVPRSPTPDQIHSNSNSNSNSNTNTNATDYYYEDPPQHRCKQEESKPQDDSEQVHEDEDDVARMLLGLSQIVSKEMSCNSNCMKKKQNKNMNNSHTNHQYPPRSQQAATTTANDLGLQADVVNSGTSFAIPECITFDHRNGTTTTTTNSNSNNNNNNPNPNNRHSNLISVSSNDSMEHHHTKAAVAAAPVAVRSSNHYHPPSPPRSSNYFEESSLFHRTTTLRPPSLDLQQRIRTVSLVSEDMAMIPNATRGGEHQQQASLSPLLLPLSPSRDLSVLGIHEHISPRSRHLPRFRHPLFRQELELLERQQNEQYQRNVLCAAAMVNTSSAAAAMVTPVPRQPRPVLFFGAGNHPSSMSGSNSGSASNNVGGYGVRDSAGHERDRKVHAPLEFPPLLLTVNTKRQQKLPQQQQQQHQPRPPTSSGVASRINTTRSRKPPTTPPTRVKKRSPAKKQTTTKQQQQQHKHKHQLAQHTPTTTGKKFSWKAYPELEEFLIANREEYLSFSARNYTIEQRDYNNRLTAQLLEHATASGYPQLFHNCAFSAVRDRIRSYYKSYVQSFKRRKERQQQLRQKALEGDVSASSTNNK